MITRDEIREVAAKVQLQPTVVEKDYVLGWVLGAIYNHTKLKNWIFKGGTCLKKCYFETYRFSEDLDFSCLVKNIPTEDELKRIFFEIADWIMEASGIEIPKNAISFEVFRNLRGTTSIQGKITYRGPVRPELNIKGLPRIKLDLTFDEPVVLATVTKNVAHPYSDNPQKGINVLCYSYEEIFAEKIRALAQRLRPRDLYDVIHLYRRQDLNPNRKIIKTTIAAKCKTRGIDFPTIVSIQNHNDRASLESEWNNQLSHQLSTLPPFEEFFNELPKVFEWLSGSEIEMLEQISQDKDGEVESGVVQELVQDIGLLDENYNHLEKIRFAASNRLILQLGYQGSMRAIEPYSLARSKNDNLLLCAIKSATGEPRRYKINQIESVEVTNKPFTPRYLVEITSSGQMPVHQLTRKKKGYT